MNLTLFIQYQPYNYLFTDYQLNDNNYIIYSLVYGLIYFDQIIIRTRIVTMTPLTIC